MRSNRNSRRAWLAGTAAAALLAGTAAAAQPVQADFAIAAGDLGAALSAYAKQSGVEIFYQSRTVEGRRTAGLNGAYEPRAALAQLIAGTGLVVAQDASGVLIVREAAQAPQGGSAAGASSTVEALIVTAQKREEDIQDVPIAISAFSQEQLERSQVAGGPDLYTQVPNFSFTKTNFTGYSIQIRGIGTQAVSATTDPAVAVAFNNTPFIRNRFFEQEFYDLERVEVLRGPQGTLYGRNATAGVVNIISAKPKFYAEAKAGVNVGNYNTTRIEAMANVPLVEDKVALRLAGAWTKRNGYALNEFTGKSIDGRDLWSTRVSLRFEPTDRISANLIWEHFEEDDDRLRSGKQLCKTDIVTEIGGIPVPPGTGSAQSPAAYVAQGCTRVSLYSDEAFQTPNGDSLPYFAPLADIGLFIISGQSPYRSKVQSRDLRVIESTVEPEYRASSDIAELQVALDLTDNLTLQSETAYGSDEVFSLQDYNRFTTTTGVFDPYTGLGQPNGIVGLDGFFCDPQLGCSDRLLLVDLSSSKSTQFSQEFRLSSEFNGSFNFSLGANFLRHDAFDKYYVFINTLSLWAMQQGAKNPPCFTRGREGGGEIAPIGSAEGVKSVTCPYLEPNPIGALNDTGRNYFLSKNPYRLISYAVFGEAYWNVADNLKLTGGLRFTVDKKRAPQIPSWLLGGPEDGPYPVAEILDQEWREPTGRLALDWKPDLAFTDETLLYASYAHGYKAGGANPPPPVFATYGSANSLGQEPIPDTFGPEFVDAFEIGTKNTLLDGRLTLNLTGFYYDYEGYQVSEIRNRSAVNSNYDSEVWGIEVEADWRPLDNLKLSFKGGYNGTRIADGETSVDLMDRAAGNPDWKVMRPFPTIPSNCILPVYVVTAGNRIRAGFPISSVTSWDGDCIDAYYNGLDPVTRLPYVENPTQMFRPQGGIQPLAPEFAGYPGFDPLTAPNNGRGFSKDLGGNELPNAPRYTATLSGDYTLPLAGDWTMTFHGDAHWQAASWWRVFNDHEYNRLDEFYTINLAALLVNEDAGWNVMAYIKNVTDEDALTGAFLNSDDSGLTTNVFLTEPRLYGLRVTKTWTDAPFFGGLIDGVRRAPDKPYPVQVEIGGGISRFDGDAEIYGPWVPPALASSPAVQEQNLDWGDIRNVKLTYAPGNGWRAWTAYQFGRTNGAGRGAAYEDVPTVLLNGRPFERDNRAITLVRDSEEYAVVDFMVGKEVGIGAWDEGAKSTLSAGLRYANIQSMSKVTMDGITDSYLASVITLKYGDQHYNSYKTSLDSAREFEGAGPALSWASSIRLAGDDEGGRADLDWNVGGAVLFGKRTTDSVEDRYGGYHYWEGSLVQQPTPDVIFYDELIERHRSEDVTVPNLTLSLGLSYTVDRIKVSTGYSYDRFFDAIDGGFDEAKQYDRTIHGPYLKFSVGFGG